MKTITVIQHTEAEYLGLLEDHLEGRNIRFTYKRPFAANGMLPEGPGKSDGLMLLGGGPYGLVSGHILPSLGPELRLTRACLAAGLPVVGIGLGAVILAVAAGGGVSEAGLRFGVEQAVAVRPGLLGGFLPDRMPLTCYLRDAPILPPGVEVLSVGDAGQPMIFAVGKNSLGFLGHPGMKFGMAEDLIMEFDETPENTRDGLDQLAAAQGEIAEALGPLMVGLTAHTGWMNLIAPQNNI